jgi:hypothetical protein
MASLAQESIDVSVGNGSDSVPIVAGLLGTFWLRAAVQNHHAGTTVYSNMLHMNVFDQFGIKPARVVLLPSQTLEFNIEGGPLAASEHVHAVFQSSQSSIASVERLSGLLTAQYPGKARITAILVDSGTGKELARTDAEVSVVLPTKVSIGPEAAFSLTTPLQCGGKCPTRLIAQLADGANEVLSRNLLPAPRGSISIGGEPQGCRFDWEAFSDSAAVRAVFFPAASGRGMDAVDVFLTTEAAQAFVMINVIVRCEGLQAPLRATQKLNVSAVPSTRLAMGRLGGCALSEVMMQRDANPLPLGVPTGAVVPLFLN